MAAAPSGFPGVGGCCGTAKVKSAGHWIARRPTTDEISVFDVLNIAHAIRIRTPGGRPAWMPAVFGSSHGWRVRKWRWVAAGLNEVDPPGCFLWLLSLHQQRK